MLNKCILLMSAAVMTLVAVAAHSNLAVEKATYRPVPGWLQLPDGFQFGPVTGVATDSADHLYVFHRGKKPLTVFDAKGKFLRAWGDDQVKTAHAVRIDPAGNVWTTDIGTHQVHKYDQEGKLLLSLGKKNTPGETPETFNKPADVAVAPDGTIYVADGYGNSRVVKFSKDGKYLKAWGKKGKGEGEFNLPHAIFLDGKGKVYVGDRENNRIQVFDGDGKFLAQWPDSGAPFGLFLHGDRMLVADGRANAINVLNLEGKKVATWGMKGMEAGQFRLPHWVCRDSQGAIYVAEVDGKRVQKFIDGRP